MSSHRNSAYSGESLLEMPARDLSRVRGREFRSPARARSTFAQAPDQIWGKYNNYRANGVAVSVIVHIALVGLLLSGIFVSHQITQRETRQTVTLIAPSPDTYALPAAKTVISGGGGGGDHDVLPAPKGHLPKPALQQITPPAIVMRNEKPKLAVEPTVVVRAAVLAWATGPELEQEVVAASAAESIGWVAVSRLLQRSLRPIPTTQKKPAQQKSRVLVCCG
jgi:hypothetical protein